MVPRYRAHIGNISQPPEVVLAADSSPPLRCFAFRGNGSISVRLLHAVRVSHVALENPPMWAVTRPRAAPRWFALRGWVTSVDEMTNAQMKPLGHFEAALH